MVNVTINDGVEYEKELKESIKKDLENGYMELSDISEKYGIGRNRSLRIKRELGGNIHRRSPNHRQIPNHVGVKNYSYSKYHGKYHIYKAINGKRVFFAYVKSEDTAKEMVERLKLVNWDKNEMPRIRKELINEGYDL